MPDIGPVVVAVDQGTSSTKAIAVTAEGRVVARASVPIGQSHPKPGWVEQDGVEIARSFLRVIADLSRQIDGSIVSIGISSQRESAIVWDRVTGEPLGPLLGWQDRRTVSSAAEFDRDDAAWVRQRSGLPIDPMFSALKIGWLLDEVDPARRLGSRLAAGTVDSWLLFTLTGEHRVEVGNASRMQLMDLTTRQWDPDLMELFNIPVEVLPRIKASDDNATVSRELAAIGGVRISGVLGDSHAALYGHGVRSPGAVKVTYGTGSSLMGVLGSELTGDALVKTVAWQVQGSPTYAFEGNILSTGSTLVWVGKLLGCSAAEIIDMAKGVSFVHGLDLVPAFAGLAAPWWRDDARATLQGMTLATSAPQIARAAVDSIALQIDDVVEAAEIATGEPIRELLVDGAPSGNDWLMQLQSSISQRSVVRPDVFDLSALGVAQLAAESCGFRPRETTPFDHGRHVFEPTESEQSVRLRKRGWRAAVAAALASGADE